MLMNSCLILAILFIVFVITKTTKENYGNIQLSQIFDDPFRLQTNKDFGDMKLANWQRRIHNLDNLMRIEVHQPNYNHPGGSIHGTSRERYIAELLHRKINQLQRHAREDIARRRIPYEHNYPSPLGGGIGDCHFNECQFALDSEGAILGIPSVPGVIHPYYENKDYKDRYFHGKIF